MCIYINVDIVSVIKNQTQTVNFRNFRTNINTRFIEDTSFAQINVGPVL